MFLILCDWLNRNRRQSNLNSEDLAVRLLLYKRQRNLVSNMIRNARKRHVDVMIRKAVGDQRRLWRVVRYVLRNDHGENKSKLPSELTLEDGVLILDPQTIR